VLLAALCPRSSPVDGPGRDAHRGSRRPRLPAHRPEGLPAPHDHGRPGGEAAGLGPDAGAPLGFHPPRAGRTDRAARQGADPLARRRGADPGWAEVPRRHPGDAERPASLAPSVAEIGPFVADRPRSPQTPADCPQSGGELPYCVTPMAQAPEAFWDRGGTMNSKFAKSLAVAVGLIAMWAAPAHAAGCNGVVNIFQWGCAPWDNNNGPQ